MKFIYLRFRKKTEKSTSLNDADMHQMKEFYLVLLKIKKNRPSFDVDLVMTEVYSKAEFKKFICYFYND